MRCRSQDQVPACFRDVKCPYPQAQTAYTSFGATNYSLVGPENGEVVVCFHGLNGSRMLFQEVDTYIARNGNFRVLCFDLYAHGLSNAPPVDLCPAGCGPSCCSCSGPKGRYDLDFFVDQTDELLWLLGLDKEPLNLVGFSLGGTIAVAFAKRFPRRVRRLVAMSPSGFIPKVPPIYYVLQAFFYCLVPLAPHVLCTYWYKQERFTQPLINPKNGAEGMDPESAKQLWSRFVWQLFVKQGVARATLAICRRVNWFNLSELFEETGRHDRPVLLIWGERDRLNPVMTIGQKVKGFFSNATMLTIPRAGHIVLVDRPAEVVPRIVSFLKLPPDTRMAMTTIPQPMPVQMQPMPSQQEGNASGDAVGAFGNAADRADQMPVPAVLGHAEDLGKADERGSQQRL